VIDIKKYFSGGLFRAGKSGLIPFRLKVESSKLE
jgi:hypothetical protein